jgi:hypothetical protein
LPRPAERPVDLPAPALFELRLLGAVELLVDRFPPVLRLVEGLLPRLVEGLLLRLRVDPDLALLDRLTPELLRADRPPPPLPRRWASATPVPTKSAIKIVAATKRATEKVFVFVVCMLLGRVKTPRSAPVRRAARRRG